MIILSESPRIERRWPKLDILNKAGAIKQVATTSACRERKPWKTVNRSNIPLPLVTFLRIRVKYLRIHHNVAKNKARKNDALHYFFYIPFIISELVAMVVGRDNIHQKNVFRFGI